jgi:hypothetical protein
MGRLDALPERGRIVVAHPDHEPLAGRVAYSEGVDYMLDRWCPKHDLYLLDVERWRSWRPMPRRFDAVAEACTHRETCIRPTHPEVFERGDIVINVRTGELVAVLANNGATLSVRRGVQTSPAGMLAGDELCVTGHVEEREL